MDPTDYSHTHFGGLKVFELEISVGQEAQAHGAAPRMSHHHE